MSPSDQPDQSAAPEGATANPVTPEKVLIEAPSRPSRPAPARPARRSGGGTAALALLLALVAAAVAGYVGWRQWQQEQGSVTGSQNLSAMQQRVETLEAELASQSEQRGSLSKRLDDGAQVNRSLRAEVLGQAERSRHLEDAVAKLAQKSLSGRDGMLLDETESLLRMAGERYRLFHDAQGAAAAYGLADQTVAAVNDGGFSGLRQSINAEREALARSQPGQQVAALEQLQTLRSEIATWPLKPLDRDAAPATGGWARIGRALAGVISVQRDDGAPLAVADARLARELAALDLAHAQAALLAHDSAACAEAIKRVDAALASQFDVHAPAVQRARAALQQLLAGLPTSAPVELGAALAELRNLRAVRALSPAPASSAPASASSAVTGGVQP